MPTFYSCCARFRALPLFVLLCGLAVLTVAPAASAATGPICQVTTSGTPSGAGTWASPLDLQTALSTGACTEVWVASGSYMPTVAAASTPADQAISFVIRPGIGVYGGFVGTEVQRDARDPVTNVSELSGNIGSVGDQADNSYHVVVMDGTTSAGSIGSSTVLDGFTIAWGFAMTAAPDDQGAGLLCIGQGIGHACSPTLANLIFSRNIANQRGAALCNLGSAGGVSSPSLRDVVFNNNMTTGPGGAMFNGGSNGGDSSPRLSNVAFNDNASASGGAMYNDGSGGTSSPTLDDVSFIRNHSQQGGALFNDASNGGTSSPTVTNTTFSGNRAFDKFNPYLPLIGGAVVNIADGGGTASGTFTNVTFFMNTASFGGALANSADDISITRPVLENVTLRANAASSGGAMFNVGAATSPSLHNAILWRNTFSGGAEIANLGSATASVDHSVFYDGCASGDGNTCTNVLSTDPKLPSALADNGGTTQTLLPGAGSSAIDAGDDAICAASRVNGRDQRGVTRPQGAHCDIGAVEVVVATSLNVTVAGLGHVDAPANPPPLTAGISACTAVGGVCSADYVQHASVTLAAAADAHQHFLGWGGDCSASGAVTMDAARNCTAAFAVNTHSVSGTVSGLAGSGLTLRLNGGDDLAILGNGSFSFSTALDYASGYTVSVFVQPSGPAQTCTVNNASGSVPDADVSNVAVICATNTHVVTGTVGTGVGRGSITPATQNVADGGDAILNVSAATGWHIDSAAGCGGALNAAIFTTGAITADCTVTANFAIDTRHVGGTVSGLAGNGLVLQLNGSHNLPISANGSFVFATALDYGTSYAVSVASQPSGPVQTCTVSNASGSLPATDVTNVAVSCATNNHVVTGAVGSGDGSISPPTQSVADGGNATLNVAAATGWHIDSVAGCGGSENGATFTTGTITADCTVTANFAIDRFAVSAAASTGHGSISPSSINADYGSQAVFTLSPNAHYHVASVTGCGGTLDGNIYTTAPIIGPCSITATFAQTLAPYVAVPTLDRRLLLLLAGLLGGMAVLGLQRG